MTIEHHPDEALLLDYASGALTEGWSLAIAAHLAICPICRNLSSQLDAIGGHFLSTANTKTVAKSSFTSVLAHIENTVEKDPIEEVNQSTDNPVLPEPIRSYAGGDFDDLQWRRLGLGAYQFVVPMEGDQEVARLLRIPAGQPVPEHTHNGRELTLVFAGAFEDMTGRYGRGDVQEADETIKHRPYAVEGEDCICLAVTDAPLRFSNTAARIVQPFLGI